MKPTVFSTSLAFLLLGGALFAWGLFGLPSPTDLALGASAAAIGLGLLLRVRVAYHGALALALGDLGLSGYRLWRALAEPHHAGVVKAGLALAGGLYLLVSLVVVRAEFRAVKRS